MSNFLKTHVFLIYMLWCPVLFGQYAIDSRVKNEFDNLYNQQPSSIQKKRYIKGFDDGFALVLEYKSDTLNPDRYRPVLLDTSKGIVEEVTEEKNNVFPDTAKYNQWMVCQAVYFNDTLGIGCFFGLFSGVGVSVKIIGNKCIGEYLEYVENDSIYRNNLSEPKMSDIIVPASVEGLILNKLPKKPGEIFYGKILLITKPFYVDNEKFTDGYIAISHKISYLFTAILTDGKEK